MHRIRERVRQMFQHAYDGYLQYGAPYDELRPLSCDAIDTWGSYSLTLIDALDTLAVMGNYTEFGRVVQLLRDRSFDADINVSVFETNIRIIGGLLSAHLLSHHADLASMGLVKPGWPCEGPLLDMAEDVAQRLLPAFDTSTGMPYGTVNLRHGVPYGETSVTCTAGIGTFILEFGTISRLTGNPVYEDVAMNALSALYKHRSQIGLYGNHIDVQTGRWIAQDAGIGAGVDSYFEYLVKGSILLEKPALMAKFLESKAAIDRYLKREDWYVWVSMSKGQITLPVFQSLEAYWPGLLSLYGNTKEALRVLHNYQSVWRQYGFLPEFYNIPTGEAGTNRENYPLRPELIESVMYLYRATNDPFLLEVGENILESIEHSAKTTCGYATIRNVLTHQQEDRMESFFLAETTKYLYLLFDPDNVLHNDGGIGNVVNVVKHVEVKAAEPSEDIITKERKCSSKDIIDYVIFGTTRVEDKSSCNTMMKSKVSTPANDGNNENEDDKTMTTLLKLVQSMFHTTVGQHDLKKSKFDREKFYQHLIRKRVLDEESYKYNTSVPTSTKEEKLHELLLCRAQPFLQRLTLIGEFY
uniref:alpha-1,2-Mannosidase n=1 Tax=Anopheles culicifacies TaxID=139723 RepID=A0A182MH85_9DIPT